MIYHIITNHMIYDNYKNEVLSFKLRIFKEPYFYDLDTYEDPIDLTGLNCYLSSIEQIVIDASATFIDFVNIILILKYLNDNNYKNLITVNFLIQANSYKSAIISSTNINYIDIKDVNSIYESIKTQKRIDKTINFPGFYNFQNFYNLLLNYNLLVETLDDDYDDYDFDEKVDYLYNRFINFGLNKEFYSKYLKDKENEL